MSGLLRKLASRAQGSATGIRPVARLPFAPAPLLVEEATELPSAPVRLVRPVQQSPEPAAAAAGRAPGDSVGPVEAFGNQGHDPSTARPSPASVPRIRASAESVAETGTPSPPTGRISPPRVPDPPADRPPAVRVGGRPQPMGAELAPPPRVPGSDTGEPPAGPIGQTRTRLRPTPRAPALPDVPSPLLPEHPAAFPASTVGPPGAWPARLAFPQPRAQPLEQVTEVHVSIGRVEIVAPSEPAKPPAHPPRERDRGMSLDDYLRRKSGGR